VTYTVKPGDTLSGIADLFGVTVDDIVRANNLADPNALQVGDVLTIPGHSPIPTPTVITTTLTPAIITATATLTFTVIVPTPTLALPPVDVTPPLGPTANPNIP
jgi:LysM repeat protein